MSNHDGLVYAWLLDGKGGGRKLTWEELQRGSSGKGILWLHLDATDPAAVQWLTEKSGLDAISVAALLEEETRPRVVGAKEALLVILRGVNCNPGADPDDMVALRMWVEEHRVISLRRRRILAMQDMDQKILTGKGPGSTGELLAMASNSIIDRMGDVISDIDDRVDDLEESVLTEQSHELRPKLAAVRRQVISLRRYISPQRDVMARIQHERIPWIGEMHRLQLRETAERTARFVEDLDAARDRAAITQEELNSRLAEQMNRTMYVLSIVAAIFLPLGLLTGLLGINVGGIPGAENPSAFIAVCVFLVALAAVQFWAFRRMRWV